VSLQVIEKMVARDGIEPPTPAFYDISGRRKTVRAPTGRPLPIELMHQADLRLRNELKLGFEQPKAR
jgi:hypothetical protein